MSDTSASYAVSVDLAHGRDYADLYRFMRSEDATLVMAPESGTTVWTMASSMSAERIKGLVAGFLTNGEPLLVVQITDSSLTQKH